MLSLIVFATVHNNKCIIIVCTILEPGTATQDVLMVDENPAYQQSLAIAQRIELKDNPAYHTVRQCAVFRQYENLPQFVGMSKYGGSVGYSRRSSPDYEDVSNL